MDQRRTSQKPRLRTLPSRWQKRSLQTRCVGLRSHDLSSKPCPCGCPSVIGGGPGHFVLWFLSYNLTFPRCVPGATSSHVPFPRFLCQPRGPLGGCPCTFPPAFFLYSRAVAVDTQPSDFFSIQECKRQQECRLGSGGYCISL